jgi:hypothetical protein
MATEFMACISGARQLAGKQEALRFARELVMVLRCWCYEAAACRHKLSSYACAWMVCWLLLLACVRCSVSQLLRRAACTERWCRAQLGRQRQRTRGRLRR